MFLLVDWQQIQPGQMALNYYKYKCIFILFILLTG